MNEKTDFRVFGIHTVAVEKMGRRLRQHKRRLYLKKKASSHSTLELLRGLFARFVMIDKNNLLEFDRSFPTICETIQLNSRIPNSSVRLRFG